MAEVGRVTPGKPIWPGHHGEAVERVTPGKDEPEGRKRRQGEEKSGNGSHPQEEKHGHVDEYV